MQSSWSVSYKYQKENSTGWTVTSTTVKAETEATAISLVKDKRPGCTVIITSIKRL